jgi:hypothetical protein
MHFSSRSAAGDEKFYIYTGAFDLSSQWRNLTVLTLRVRKRERLLLQRFPIKNFVICLRVYAPQ